MFAEPRGNPKQITIENVGDDGGKGVFPALALDLLTEQQRALRRLLMAKKDHLVSPASTEGIRPHVGSQDSKSMMIDAGHVGLAVGSKAQKTIWPEATRWLADRSTLTCSPEASATIERNFVTPQ